VLLCCLHGPALMTAVVCNLAQYCAGHLCRLRQRQMRNAACALLLSHGIPMFQMGDEYGHSKAGNNNTYCHDSPLNWVDWQEVARDEQGFARFMRGLIAFRCAVGGLLRSSVLANWVHPSHVSRTHASPVRRRVLVIVSHDPRAHGSSSCSRRKRGACMITSFMCCHPPFKLYMAEPS
jgi:pullulanase/glycogen debranching enzyme